MRRARPREAGGQPRGRVVRREARAAHALPCSNSGFFSFAQMPRAFPQIRRNQFGRTGLSLAFRRHPQARRSSSHPLLWERSAAFLVPAAEGLAGPWGWRGGGGRRRSQAKTGEETVWDSLPRAPENERGALGPTPPSPREMPRFPHFAFSLVPRPSPTNFSATKVVEFPLLRRLETREHGHISTLLAFMERGMYVRPLTLLPGLLVRAHMSVYLGAKRCN